MTKPTPNLPAPWIGCLLIVAALVPSCATDTNVAERGDLEADETTEALTQAEYDCERTKRECLVTADCDPYLRDACESAFRACREPVRAEKEIVRAECRAERKRCDAEATSDAEHHACHVAEHECKLPVDPPEAVCHIDALECIWEARSTVPDDPTRRADDEAVKACREEEKACKDSLRLDRKDLPKPPHCAPPPPVCPAAEPTEPEEEPDATDSDPDDAESLDHFACERIKRECLIDANCDADERAVCEAAFRACEEPIRAERKRVHELCRTEREACDAEAADEAEHHACHIDEHRCRLPVDPPEAVCRIEAEECLWDARGMTGMSAPPPSAAELACSETEHACVEAKRMRLEDLPKPPHCPPVPPRCVPAPLP